MNDEETLGKLLSYRIITYKKRFQMAWQIIAIGIGVLNTGMLLRLTFSIDWAVLCLIMALGLGVMLAFGALYERYLWPRENQYDVNRIAPYSKEVVTRVRRIEEQMNKMMDILGDE